MAAVQIDCPSKDLFYKEAEGDDGKERRLKRGMGAENEREGEFKQPPCSLYGWSC